VKTRRQTGQLLPEQQTMPHGLFASTVGAAHRLLPVHAAFEPQRQTEVDPLVSHHSPLPQQVLPQQAVSSQIVLQPLPTFGLHRCPAAPAEPPPVPAPPASLPQAVSSDLPKPA